MKKRMIGILAALVLCLSLLSTAALAGGASEKIQIGGVDINSGNAPANTAYSHSVANAFIDSCTLTLNNGASIGGITYGNVYLTIEVNGNATINGNIFHNSFGATSAFPSLDITGNGTLTVNGAISGAGGLSIEGDAGKSLTVNVTSSEDTAIVAGKQNEYFSVGNATVNATGAEGIAVLGNMRVSDGAIVTATGTSGCGINVWKYEDNQWQGGTLTVSGGSSLSAKSTADEYAVTMISAERKGTLKVEDTSTVKLEQSGNKLLEGNASFPASYQWKTAPGGSAKQAPYDASGSLNSNSYFEMTGNSVFVPQISDGGTVYVGESKTVSITAATATAAPGTVSYQWYLDGSAVSGATGSSYTFTDSAAVGQRKVACEVKLNSTSGAIRKETTVTVRPRDISGSVESSGFSVKWYDNFNPVVKYNGNTLVYGTDYKVVLSGTELASGDRVIVLPGTQTCQIQFLGQYTGTKNVTLSIVAVSLSDVTVTLNNDGVYPYNGAGQVPGITVTYNGYTLTGGLMEIGTTYDYLWPGSLLTMNNNSKEPGTYSFEMRAGSSGRFTGTKTVNYQIAKVTPSADRTDLAAVFTYGDTFDAPDSFTWTVTDSVRHTMTEGTDYTLVSPAGAVGNAGQNTATIRFTDAARYCTGDLSFSYTVNRKAIAEGDVTLSRTAIPCTGDPVMPTLSVAVRLGGSSTATPLVQDRDYTVSLQDASGGAIAQAVRAGTYQVVVTGIGNYSGTVTKTFTVERGTAAADDFTLSAPADCVYTGEAKTAAVTEMIPGSVGAIAVKYYTDAGLTNEVSPVAVGTYYVGITAGEGADFNAVAAPLKVGSFAITAREISAAAIADLAPVVYNTGAHTPDITATYNNMTLVKGTDYTLSHTDNVNVGNATITVSGVGNYTGTTAKTFAITQATPTITIPENQSVVYDSDPVAIGDVFHTYTGDGSVSANWYADENGVRGGAISAPTTVGTYWIGVSAGAGSNYTAAAETYQKFVIVPRPVTVTAVDQVITYGQNVAQDAAYASAVLAGGDVIDSVTLTANALTVTDASTVLPSAAVIKDGDADVTENYDITYADGTLTVEQKAVGIQWGTETAFVYNGTAQAPTATATGLVGDDVCILTVSGAQTDYRASAYTATVTGLSNPNYKLPDSGLEQAFTIGKRTLTITAEDKSAFAGQRVPELTYTVSGFVGGDTLITRPTLTTDAVMNTAGTYTITAGGADAGGNYAITYVPGALTVSYLPTYRVTVETTGDGGTVKTNWNFAAYGQTVTLTVKAHEGYVPDALTVTDSSGKELALTDKGNGRFTFEMPARWVTVEAAFAPVHVCPSVGYTDVDAESWHHEAVDYVLEKGLMDGVSATAFGPGGTATRGTLVEAIWRNEGCPVVDYLMTYSDVEQTDDHAEAIRWATSVGIVNGFPDGSFHADEAITREQLATLFYRYEQFKGEGFAGDWSYQLPYADADEVADWAYEAVCWNTMKGIVQGDGTNFAPKGTATRDHVAQLLMNYLEK